MVHAREQAHLGKLAHAREKAKLDVRIRRFEGAIQSAQVVSVLDCHFRRLQRVKNRLVVLVHEHDGSLSALCMQGLEQMREAFRRKLLVSAVDSECPLRLLKLPHHRLMQIAGGREVAASEVEFHHRERDRPVPMLVDGQPLKEPLVAFEHFLDGVEQEALAEAARPREEIVLRAFDKISDVFRFVNVVIPVLSYFAKGLNADGEFEAGHWPTDSTSKPTTLRASLLNSTPTRYTLPSALAYLSA